MKKYCSSDSTTNFAYIGVHISPNKWHVSKWNTLTCNSCNGSGMGIEKVFLRSCAFTWNTLFFFVYLELELSSLFFVLWYVIIWYVIFHDFKVTRHLCCKITPLLHVSLNNSTSRPCFKNLAAELLREMCKGGLIFAWFCSISV